MANKRVKKRKPPVEKYRVPNRPPPMIHERVIRQIAIDEQTQADVKECLRLMKETDARSRVMFAKIHNLQQDIATLQTRLVSVVRLLVVRDNPDEQRENEAAIKQFLLQYGTYGPGGQSGSVRGGT